jgi:GAF domain-containing protein
MALLLAAVGLSAALPLLDVLPWRHVYVLPVLVVAFRFGVVAGGLAGGLVPLAQAPGWLSRLETGGMTAAVADEVIGSVTMLGIAFLVGVLATAARRQRSRYDTLLTIQRVVAEARPLTETLERLRGLLAERCGAASLALVVRDADGLAVAGGERVLAGSAVARSLGSGKPVFVSDTGTDVRPRRALAVPLLAQGQAIGVLALERLGEVSSGERASLAELGASLGLALENARLEAVRRRFNAELSEKVAAAT